MTGLVAQFGALGVFLLMVPEAACIPIPSEVTLLFAGYATSRGWMSLPMAVLGATAGNLTGSMLAYWVGASGVLARTAFGHRLLSRWGALLERHGTKAVLIARLMPLARTFVSLPAGARRVELLPFIGLTALGSALWASAFVLVGTAAGAAWTAVDSVAGRALLAAGLAFAVWSVWPRRR